VSECWIHGSDNPGEVALSREVLEDLEEVTAAAGIERFEAPVL